MPVNKYAKGGTSTLIRIAFRNIWRNKRRTVFCLNAVGITAFVLVFFIALEDGMTESINDTVQVYEQGHVRVVSAQYEAENEYRPVQYPVADGKSWRELASSIRGIAGVREIFPRVAAMATLQESTVKHAILWGLDIESEMAANDFNLAMRTNGLVEGRYPSPDTNECAIGHIFARKAGLSIGDEIPLKTVSAQFSDRYWSPVITGIFNFDYYKYDEQVILADIARLQRLLVLGEGTQQLVIFADDERQSPRIAAAVQNLLGKDSVVTDWNENYWVAMQKMNAWIYIVAYAIALVVASFMIINTITMIILERTKEIGLMGSLGMTRAEIVKVFFFESLFLAGLGALCGVTIGGILTAVVSNFPIRMGDMYGNTFSESPMSGTIFFKFSFERILQAWLIGVVIASLFTLIPSLRSARIEPVEAMRG
jgi:putative ABC transport system permease protein